MQASKNHGWIASLAIIAAVHLSACGTSIANLVPNYDTSSAEVTSAGIASLASASDSGGSVVASHLLQNSHWITDQFLNLLFEPKAYASTCSAAAAVKGATCAGAVMTLSLSGCSGIAGTWNGSLTLTYNSASACTAAYSNGLMSMGAGNSVTITTTNASLAVGAFVVSTSSNQSGFSIPKSGGIQVTCGTSGCATSRTVNILGLNRILSAGSTSIYNHTLNTPIPFTITGTGMSRQITSGQLQLQHNLSQFVANSLITQNLTFSNNCCVPTAGIISTAFSTGKKGAETLVFSGDCGVATVNANTIALPYCM